MGPVTIQEPRSTLDQANLLHRITKRIRRSLELQDILTATAAEVRSFLGTDRVLIYKFHPDHSGQVIAEAVEPHRLPSLLGLNFPADDIPPHARELFIQSGVRSIVDVAARQIGHSPAQELEDEGTAEDMRYRPVDPCHVEYLTAMGVQSSLVVPILHQEQLWGLMVSHHSESRAIADSDLQAVQMVVDQLSVAIAQATLLAQAREQARRETTINRIANFLHSLSTIELQAALEETVLALQGSGGRLYIQSGLREANQTSLDEAPTAASVEEAAMLYSYGIQPVMSERALFEQMEQYSVWQRYFECRDRAVWAISDLYRIPDLRNLQAAFRNTQIRGILILPLRYRQQFLGYLTVFRNEVETETLWAGHFDPDQRQVQPRLSFDVWREAKQGQAHDWSTEDIELAQTLANQFATAIQQYDMHQQLQALNANLETQVQERTAKLKLATKQQRILFRVVTKIRASLDLETIFKTTAREVRRALNADRVGVFRFDPDSNFNEGEFVSEDVLPAFSSALSKKICDHCFGEHYAAQYHRGRMQVVADIQTAGLQDCHVEVLSRLQIRSQIVAPLMKGDQLWGLLCVHQCAHPKNWQTSEIQFVTQIAGQLGVALDQADLLAQTQDQTGKLAQALEDLQKTQTQLIQTEKMSSLGQLVAGVAHEINNPVNFIYGNLSHASAYTKDLLNLLHLYQSRYPDSDADIQEQAEQIDIEFIAEDLPKIMSSMQVGTDRIRQIVQSLRNFSHLDQAEMKPVNIHEGIESTLLILHHRLKEQGNFLGVEVIKDYGDLPLVECYAGQMNQVFMNVLSNAIDALEHHWETTSDLHKGQILIRTRLATQNNGIPNAVIQIIDNGPGMPEQVKTRVFDPFFTTKPIGKGTGLGLSISYQIVVDKHGGIFKCISQPGEGTEFWIEIPIQQPACT